MQGSNSWTMRSWPKPKPDTWPTEPPRCPYNRTLRNQFCNIHLSLMVELFLGPSVLVPDASKKWIPETRMGRLEFMALIGTVHFQEWKWATATATGAMALRSSGCILLSLLHVHVNLALTDILTGSWDRITFWPLRMCLPVRYSVIIVFIYIWHIYGLLMGFVLTGR